MTSQDFSAEHDRLSHVSSSDVDWLLTIRAVIAGSSNDKPGAASNTE